MTASSSAVFLIVIVSVLGGYFWGTYTTKQYYSKHFKTFSDELNKQYRKCINTVEKKYDIKIDWRSLKA